MNDWQNNTKKQPMISTLANINKTSRVRQIHPRASQAYLPSNLDTAKNITTSLSDQDERTPSPNCNLEDIATSLERDHPVTPPSPSRIIEIGSATSNDDEDDENVENRAYEKREYDLATWRMCKLRLVLSCYYIYRTSYSWGMTIIHCTCIISFTSYVHRFSPDTSSSCLAKPKPSRVRIIPPTDNRIMESRRHQKNLPSLSPLVVAQIKEEATVNYLKPLCPPLSTCDGSSGSVVISSRDERAQLTTRRLIHVLDKAHRIADGAGSMEAIHRPNVSAPSPQEQGIFAMDM